MTNETIKNRGFPSQKENLFTERTEHSRESLSYVTCMSSGVKLKREDVMMFQ
jgi:hypothetical protein